MSTLLLAGLVVSSLLPQTPVAASARVVAEPRVAVLGGLVDRQGQVDLTRLGLGDGGVDAERRAPEVRPDGRFRTSGGVLVRALAQGVKLDFPSGGELLVDPRGRVHVRDGSCTLPSFSGVRIVTADGAAVDVIPQNGSDLPPREVVVRDGRTAVTLWRAGRAASRATRREVFPGRTYHALGDGRMLFEAATVGPVVVLDRLLCPRDCAEDVPSRCAIVVGDLLARSLVEVGAIARERAKDDPRTQNIAAALAANAPRMFAPGRVFERPAGARGDFVVPLDAGFRLALTVPSSGPIVLALAAPTDPVPLCEWTTTNTTRLHLVQRDAGRNGGPRYLMRGYDLGQLVDGLLGFTPSPTARARAKRVLAELGAD